MTHRGDAMELTDTERETLDGVAGYRNAQAVHRAVEAIVTPYADALAEARGDNPSGFWSQREWEDWSNTLSELIPEGEEASYSNPEGAQESIIEDCFRAYKTERDAALAALARVEALAKRAREATRDTENPGAATVWLASLEAALAGPSPDEGEYHAGALYGIRHPGSRNGCPYCDATIAQRDRWAAAPSPDEVGK